MTFKDTTSLTQTPTTDRVETKYIGSKDHVDQLQDYRLGQSDSLPKTPNHKDANQQYLDLAETSTSSTTTPPAETSAKHDLKFDNPAYFSQPVYAIDNKAISQSVEKYGSNLDYHQKQNLDDMISSTTLGETDKLQQALQKSTPETRNAYVDVIRRELGLDVSLTNKENGGYDLNVWLASELSKITISEDKATSPATISAGWMNAKAPVNENPWQMTTERQTVNQIVDDLSDSAAKYRKEIGQTR